MPCRWDCYRMPLSWWCSAARASAGIRDRLLLRTGFLTSDPGRAAERFVRTAGACSAGWAESERDRRDCWRFLILTLLPPGREIVRSPIGVVLPELQLTHAAMSRANVGPNSDVPPEKVNRRNHNT